MKREPMVFFVAGMLFGCVLGYMVANAGGGATVTTVPLGAAPAAAPFAGGAGAPAAPGAAAAQAPGHNHPVTPPDPTEVRGLESLAQADPGNVKVRVALGNLFMDHGEFGQAVRWYEQALALDARQPDVIVDLGACLVYMHRPDEAIARFDEALKQQPQHKKAAFNKGVAHMEAGRPAAALAVWEDLLKKYPEDPELASLKQRVAELKAGQKP